MNKKVSICVAVYNIDEQYLRECIESIIADKSPDIEIILGDDCSAEDCGKICMEYERKDSRIKCIRPEHNGGVSRMRNLMIDASNGKYILFVDGDDAVSADYITRLKEIAETEYDIVMVEWQEFETDIPKTDIKYSDIINTDGSACKVFSRACLTGAPPQIEKFGIKNSTPSSVCTKVYRRDFIVDNGLRFKEGLKKSQDVTFNTEAFFKCRKLGYLPKIMYLYRINPKSICHRYSADFESIINDCIRYDEENMKKFYPNNVNCTELWNKYKIIHFIISNFELNIFHKDNPNSKNIRKNDFLNFVGAPPFSDFFDNFDFDSCTWRERRLILKLAKNKRFCLLDFMYKHPVSFKIYGKFKNIIDFKGKE